MYSDRLWLKLFSSEDADDSKSTPNFNCLLTDNKQSIEYNEAGSILQSGNIRDLWPLHPWDFDNQIVKTSHKDRPKWPPTEFLGTWSHEIHWTGAPMSKTDWLPPNSEEDSDLPLEKLPFSSIFPAYIKFWYSYLMLFVLVLPVFHPTQFWPWRSRSLANLYIHKILRSSYLLAQEILFVVLVLCLFAVCGCLAWQLLQFSALLRQERSVRQFGPRAGLGLLIAYLFGISCGSTVILYWGILGKWLVQNKPCQRYNEI